MEGKVRKLLVWVLKKVESRVCNSKREENEKDDQRHPKVPYFLYPNPVSC